MKKRFMILAVAAVALMASCGDKKTARNEASEDSISVADTTAATLDISAVAGSYEGTLPAADCPGLKTVITLNADSTYQMQQDAIDRKDGHDEASGIFEINDGNILVLVRPSSGDRTYIKVKDADSIVMTDSVGNEPEGEMAKLYVLTRKK
ncbi:MAG: copper resistance protein NlpE [Prevotella sp.]|nr:copper resistance protein NlpE [Prevotella sp.]MDY4752820.1 copper resistance protein NlpE [Prevotella sp.]